MDFNLDNTEKVISIIAGLAAIYGFQFLRKKHGGSEETSSEIPPEVSNTTINISQIQNSAVKIENKEPESQKQAKPDILFLKRETKILFIDDDSEFKIVGILKRMGWEYTSILTDITSLEQNALVEADVVFVDIQGVGVSLQLPEEGLGLALAIKKRHPAKKVIIYSSHEDGSRFHEALQEADYSLPKTADPIRFEDTIVRVLEK